MGLFQTAYKLSRKFRWGGLLLRILYSCDISPNAKIADSVTFAHSALGVVVHGEVEIDDNCFIQHHVTIGVNRGIHGAPKIGKNVFVGPYAMILGDITVGDYVVIGAGTIVMKDIEAGSICTGNNKMIERGKNINHDYY